MNRARNHRTVRTRLTAPGRSRQHIQGEEVPCRRRRRPRRSPSGRLAHHPCTHRQHRGHPEKIVEVEGRGGGGQRLARRRHRERAAEPSGAQRPQEVVQVNGCGGCSGRRAEPRRGRGRQSEGPELGQEVHLRGGGGGGRGRVKVAEIVQTPGGRGEAREDDEGDFGCCFALFCANKARNFLCG
jgi:hypothetical protein